MTTMKCAWCGAVVPTTPKGRPKQHRNGPKTCVGSGQLATTHERLRSLAASARKPGKLLA